jgi:hypothetical protein
MAKKAEFLRAAMRVRSAIYSGNTITEDTRKQDTAWVKAVRKLCSDYHIRLPIPFKILAVPNWEGSELKRLVANVNDALGDLDIEIRVNDAIVGGDDYIELDDDWKTRATSYVAHIREVVSKAEVNESIRERIFRKLNDLQAEIDRNRTHVESLTEVFLSITEAVSKGAKHLDGAVKLVERLAGAFSGARTAKIEHDTQLRLPSPEKLGLPEPE